MSERLEATIRDRGIGFDGDIRVKIKAGSDREEDFNAIREAVQEVLERDE